MFALSHADISMHFVHFRCIVCQKEDKNVIIVCKLYLSFYFKLFIFFI